MAFHKYNVLSCRGQYSLALLPRSAFSLLHSVHLERTRLNRPSSAMRWSTFGTKPYSIISSTRSRFWCLPFSPRPNAAPRGYFVPGFFSSAGVCMRWHWLTCAGSGQLPRWADYAFSPVGPGCFWPRAPKDTLDCGWQAQRGCFGVRSFAQLKKTSLRSRRLTPKRA